jgi:hypothetical protein
MARAGFCYLSLLGSLVTIRNRENRVKGLLYLSCAGDPESGDLDQDNKANAIAQGADEKNEKIEKIGKNQ